MGFLGNSAAFAADLNLVAQILVLGFLLIGASLAKISEFKIHGRLMMALIVFQFVAVGFWMAPSLIRNLGALSSGGVGTAITISHVYFGTFAFALAIAAIIHWVEIQLKWTMRAVFSAWILVAILGIAFYAHYYLGIL